MIRRSLDTRAPASNSLIRLMVGGVFFSEGIQKFLYPAELGSGRFENLITGAGPWSADARLAARSRPDTP